MYFTFKKQATSTQLSFEDYYNALQNNINLETTNFPETQTFYKENYNKNALIEKYNLNRMKAAIIILKDIINEVYQEDMSENYDTFFIPKHSGGRRRIDAPKNNLKTILRDIKNIFENDLKVLSHNCAFAYVKQRSTKDAVIQHQHNTSKWFLKLDIKDFFTNCTPEFILTQLEKLFPFKILFEDSEIKEIFQKIIHIASLNNGLPQGTPLSPLLTNLIMIPIDHEIYHTFRYFENQKFIYTRYADDILLSCAYNFQPRNIETKLNEIFQHHNAPFRLNTEKTRYGSSAGRNWNLGLMLNKDNKITIGHKRKQRIKAILQTFFQDLTSGNPWSIIDTQVMLGQISYYKKIEPDYIDYIIQKYANKFNLNFRQTIKNILNR